MVNQRKDRRRVLQSNMSPGCGLGVSRSKAQLVPS